MRVAIFENEFQNLQASFDAVNLLYFSNSLTYENFSYSQEFGDLSNLSSYDVVIIDIDLSRKSLMDGFQLIEKIISLNFPALKIIILTGHVDIADQLLQKKLPLLPIINKPVTFEGIHQALVQ